MTQVVEEIRTIENHVYDEEEIVILDDEFHLENIESSVISVEETEILDEMDLLAAYGITTYNDPESISTTETSTLDNLSIEVVTDELFLLSQFGIWIIDDSELTELNPIPEVDYENVNILNDEEIFDLYNVLKENNYDTVEIENDIAILQALGINSIDDDEIEICGESYDTSSINITSKEADQDLIVLDDEDIITISRNHSTTSNTVPLPIDLNRSRKSITDVVETLANEQKVDILASIKETVGTDATFNNKIIDFQEAMIAHMAACTGLDGHGPPAAQLATSEAFKIANQAHHSMSQSAAQELAESTSAENVASGGHSHGVSISGGMGISSGGYDHHDGHSHHHNHSHHCEKCGAYIPSSGACFRCYARKRQRSRAA